MRKTFRYYPVVYPRIICGLLAAAVFCISAASAGPHSDIALNFDGSNTYVEIDNLAGVRVENELTFEMWVSVFTHDNSNRLWFSLTDRPGNSIAIRQARPSWANALNVDLIADGARTRYLSGESFPSLFSPRRWHHFAFVARAGESPVIYVDGEEVPDSHGGLRLTDFNFSEPQVRFSAAGAHLDGMMTEARLWTVARSSDEIRDNMNRRLSGDEEGLAAYWPMNGARGRTVLEEVRGNHGHMPCDRMWVLAEPFGPDFPADEAVSPGEKTVIGPALLPRPRGEVRYQWYRNDNPIAGAVEDTLTIAYETMKDIGDYHVIVDDETDATPIGSRPVSVSKPDWPMRRFDAARSGRTPHELAEELHLNWVIELPQPRRAWPEQLDDNGKLGFDISYEPVVAGDLIFVPSNVTDSVTAYDIDTGEERWRFSADGPVRLAPVYGEGRIYFGSDDGYMYCLDAPSGELNWRFRAAPSDRTVLGNERIISMWPVRGGPVMEDGTLYFAAGIWPMEGVFIYALNAEDGELIWRNSGTGDMMVDAYGGGSRSFGTVAPQGSLAVSGSRLIVAGGRTTPAYYDRSTGDLIQFDIDKRGGGYAVFEGGLLPVRTSVITAGTRSYSDLAWSRRVSGRAWRLVAARDRLFVVTEEGRIYCFGPEEREPVVHAREPEPLDRGDDIWADRARQILEDTGAVEGYAVMFGTGSGRLLTELLARSQLHIAAYDQDMAKVQQLRTKLIDAGYYGARATVHHGDALSRPLPPYIASLVVSEDADAAGAVAGEEFTRAVYRPLRPYGGTVYLFGDAATLDETALAAGAAQLEQAQLERTEHAVVISRPGPLPGSDIWTHQYSNAANTAYSGDSRVRAPLGISWFGGENNHRTLPRHMFGPAPQVVEGRLIILGVDHLTARCVYTGRRIWSVQLTGVGRAFTSMAHEEQFRRGRSVYFPSYYGANFRGSPYVSTRDSVYIIHRDRCLRIDLESGRTLATFRLPAREELSKLAAMDSETGSYTESIHEPDMERRWGHISTWGDYLIIGAYPHIFGDKPDIDSNIRHIARADGPDDIHQERLWHWNSTSSEFLLAMDRRTGDIRWARRSRYGFRHNAIATGGGRTFAIDNISGRIRGALARRGIEPRADAAIHAIDLESGETLWSRRDNVFGTWLSYSEKHDVLFQGGRAGGRSTLMDEPRDRMVALRGADGEKIWENDERYSGPAALHEDLGRIIFGENQDALDLLTGETVTIPHPITGVPDRWRYFGTKGCGTHNVSRYLVTFRSGAAAYYDLHRESGVGNLSGFRSGCTNNLIAADGILNAPEYTRSCTCAYQHQTSLGLVHMPETEMWTFSAYEDARRAPVIRLGVNFGAPGSRIDGNGVMWVNHPRDRQVPSPRLPLQIETNSSPRWFAGHSLDIREGNGVHRWVAASGLEAEIRMEISGLSYTAGADGASPGYLLRMHFAEPGAARPGQRVFNISIDGELVLEKLDIAAETGGSLRGLIKEFPVEVRENHLDVELREADGSELPPVINGIEIIAWQGE